MSSLNETPDPNSVARFYQGWENHNSLIAKAIAPLSPDQLLLAPAQGMWPVSVLAAHIVAARVFWLHRIMHEGPAEIAPLQALDDGPEADRTVANLLTGLAKTWTLIEGILARSTPDNLEETYDRVGANRTRTYSRRWIIWHVMEHDIHHAGEISLTLGVHGLTGLDL